MDQTELPKKYPAATDEVAKMLGMQASAVPNAPSASVPLGDLPIANLPIQQNPAANPQNPVQSEPKPLASDKVHADLRTTPISTAQASQPAYIKIAKATAPYVAIFAVGLFLYYFFFTNINLGSINLGSISGSTNAPAPAAVSAPQESSLQALEVQDLASYNAWISGFYYDVSDPNIIAPDTDNSGNGLSNFQKYLLNLNPKSYDTLGLGMADSQAISMGINPLTGGPLTASQKDIISKYIDMEVVMNRLALNNMENPGTVAGASTTKSVNYQPPQTTTQNTAPSQNVQTRGGNTVQSQSSEITTVNSGEVTQDQSVDINTSIPGELDIPDLKLSVPIIWAASTNDFETDLQEGVIHYPGTAIPGQIGTTYIAGHSSNYVWAKGDYNHVFTDLNNLKDDASFSITVTATNGQKVIYHYVVVSRKQFLPTDPAQIANTGKSLVALSTCWPVNTTSKRLVLYGQLTQVEQ